jgi:hypothetical protein
MEFYLEDVSSTNGRDCAISFPDLFALLLAPGPPCPRSVDVVHVDLQRVEFQITDPGAGLIFKA